MSAGRIRRWRAKVLSSLVRTLAFPVVMTLAACSAAPRWIAVAHPREHAILLFNADLEPLSRVTLAASPGALLASGDGASLFVGSLSDPATLLWVGRAGGIVRARLPLPGQARAIALTNDASRLLVATDSASQAVLSVVALPALRVDRRFPICAEPNDIVQTAEGDRAYVLCTPGSIAEVDLQLDILVRTSPVTADSGAGCGATHFALAENGSLLFVPCALSGNLLYVDRVTLAPWDSARIGLGGWGIAALAGGRALVTFPDSNEVKLVDLRHRTVLAVTHTPPAPRGVARDASGATGYVVTAGGADSAGAGPRAGALVAVDAKDGTVRRRVDLIAGAGGLLVWPGPHEPRPRWAAR